MTTVSDIIARAHRRLNITSASTPLSADDLAQGVLLYNEVMHGLRANGIFVPFQTQTATEDFRFGEECVGATVAMLAVRLADEFGLQPSDALQRDAEQGRRGLRGRYFVAKPAILDRVLLRRGMADWEYDV